MRFPCQSSATAEGSEQKTNKQKVARRDDEGEMMACQAKKIHPRYTHLKECPKKLI